MAVAYTQKQHAQPSTRWQAEAAILVLSGEASGGVRPHREVGSLVGIPRSTLAKAASAAATPSQDPSNNLRAENTRVTARHLGALSSAPGSVRKPPSSASKPQPAPDHRREGVGTRHDKSNAGPKDPEREAKQPGRHPLPDMRQP